MYRTLPIRIYINTQEKKKKKTRRIYVKMMGDFCFLHFFYKLHIFCTEYEFYKKRKAINGIKVQLECKISKRW